MPTSFPAETFISSPTAFPFRGPESESTLKAHHLFTRPIHLLAIHAPLNEKSKLQSRLRRDEICSHLNEFVRNDNIL